MPAFVADEIVTYYEVAGDGAPLLLFSPGGFNATIDNWRSFGIYQRLGLLDQLQKQFTCIAFDKRESGQSGGRVEQIEWRDYAAQGIAVLDHLGIERAHVMGGCIGCSIAITLATMHPDRVSKLVLYSPAGGPRYRKTQLHRFAEHASFASESGLGAVVELAKNSEKTFAQDPRVGPWVAPIRSDDEFAAEFVRRDVGEYWRMVDEMGRGLFDRDTVPGPDAERLMVLDVPALVVPGNDASHALSAAHYLHECLDGSELWNALPEEQTADNAPQRVSAFLQQ